MQTRKLLSSKKRSAKNNQSFALSGQGKTVIDDEEITHAVYDCTGYRAEAIWASSLKPKWSVHPMALCHYLRARQSRLGSRLSSEQCVSWLCRSYAVLGCVRVLADSLAAVTLLSTMLGCYTSASVMFPNSILPSPCCFSCTVWNSSPHESKSYKTWCVDYAVRCIPS